MRFKQDVKVPITRSNGQRGFKRCLKGTTPEDNGLTPEQIEANLHLLEDEPKAETKKPGTELKKSKKKEDK